MPRNEDNHHKQNAANEGNPFRQDTASGRRMTMDKLKHWSKRLRCRIVGCSLAAGNIQTVYSEIDMMYTFRNRCVRCGKTYTCRVPKEELLEYEPIRLED
jgi:hypothetical protein